MADRYLCRACSKPVTATKNHRYRSHADGNGDPCGMSSEPIPEGLEPESEDPGVPKEGADFAKCPECTRSVKLTRLGYFEPHNQTLRGGDRCPNGGTRPDRKMKETPLPGDEIPERGVDAALRPKVSNQAEMRVPRITGSSSPEASLKRSADETPAVTSAPAMATPSAEAAAPASEGVSTPPVTDEANWGDVGSAPEAASSGASTETSSPGSESISEPSAPPSTPNGSAALTGFRLGESFSATILQPFSPFLQPPEYKEPPLVFLQPPEYLGPEKPEPMGELAKELATRIKETFYSYSNRKSADNRSAQTTLGPSEIGTPCDRRLAMALMGIPAVNPGGDGWASFVGTCGHVGMGEIYTFADAGTGRYAVELPVLLGVPSVPRGTTDLLDRRDATIIDWKFMGAYSLKKFKLEGPSDTYRTQAHVYGYGAERGGEKVKSVAVVGLPRAGSSLDDMHVWTEKYDKRVALEALNRVERIAAEVTRMSGEATVSDAGTFATADDCRYCPFHLKNDKEMVRGCPGS